MDSIETLNIKQAKAYADKYEMDLDIRRHEDMAELYSQTGNKKLMDMHIEAHALAFKASTLYFFMAASLGREIVFLERMSALEAKK